MTNAKAHLEVAEVDHLHAARQGHPEVRGAHVHLRRADVHRRLLDLGAHGDVLAAEGHAPPVVALQEGPRGGPEPLRQPSTLAGDLRAVACGTCAQKHIPVSLVVAVHSVLRVLGGPVNVFGMWLACARELVRAIVVVGLRS